MRQVDDFAVGSAYDETNIKLINDINQHMSIEIKDLGTLTRYNGVGITQG